MPSSIGMDILVYLAAAVSLLYVLNLLLRTRGPLNPPPSPPALPLIGHFHLLRSPVGKSLQDLSRKYGSLFKLRLGMVTVVVASSSQMAKEIMKTRDVVTGSRPYMLVGEYAGYNFKSMALAPSGEHWKSMRKLCLTELFTVSRINSFLSVRHEEVLRMVSRLSTRSNEVITIRDEITRFAHNSMTRMLMSKAFFGDHGNEDGAQEFMHISLQLIKAANRFSIGDFITIPTLRLIDWNIPELRKLHAGFDKLLQKFLDDHRSTPGSRKTNDFVDVCIQYFANHGGDQREQDELIKALLGDFIPAGTDTSSSTVEWALAELVHNQDILEKLQQELDLVVGEGVVQESHIPELGYLEAIVKETFRLHPGGPLLIPRCAMEDVKIGGYDIKKGSSIFINIKAIHTDATVWENPLEFRPERFLGSSLDVKGQDFDLLPFGSGRRSCPGMLTGLKTVKLALANLVHAFKWQLPPGVRVHPMGEVSTGITWINPPLQVCIEQRKKCA